MHLKLASRTSALARMQAYSVARALKAASPNLEIEFLFRESLGDVNLQDPLWKMPAKGVFTEDFLGDLISGKADLVVHSWKDLPTEPRAQTEVVATLKREDSRDLLFFKKSSLAKCRSKKQVTLFSSSLRRQYNLAPFLKEALPFQSAEVRFENIRGNIPTRLKKLFASDEVDGLVLAKAAWDRLALAPEKEFFELQQDMKTQLAQVTWMVLPLSENPCAAAQGALAIEIRKDREDLKQLLSRVQDQACFDAVILERKTLSDFGGGCHQKIGISYQPRHYGMVYHLKGLTDSGQVLNQHDLLRQQGGMPGAAPMSKIAESKHTEVAATLFSSRDLNAYFQREPLKVDLPADCSGVFIAKSEAMNLSPTQLSGTLIWTAGVTTWKKLASQGLWVNGTSDGLGESEDLQLEALAPKASWYTLTHWDAAKESAHGLASYRLIAPKILPEPVLAKIRGAKSYFWTSIAHYDLVSALVPEVKTRQHACGPGKTASQLQKRQVSAQIFLNERSWYDQHG